MQYHTKLLILFILTLISVQLSAQKQIIFSEKLEWTQSNVMVNPITQEYLNMWSIDQGISSSYHPQVPRFRYRFPVNTMSDLEVKITNPVYSDIEITDDKTKDFISARLEISSSVVQERDKYYGTINFVPIIKSGNQYLRLESFDLLVDVTPKINIVNRDPQNTFESVLNSGDIYKMSITETGIYKLSYSYLKNDLKIDIDNIDPAYISIYSNEGGPLPQAISEPRTDDLGELSIQVVGGEDGAFDSQDYILFYAQGVDRQATNATNKTFEYYKNIYDNNNYVYLKINDVKGKRVTNQSNMVSETEYQTSSFDVLLRYEDDRTNLLGQYGSTQGSGQLWFGPSFSTEREQDFSNYFKTQNIVNNSTAKLKVSFAGRSDINSQFKASVDDKTFSKSISRVKTSDIESLYVSYKTISEEFSFSNNNPIVKVEYPQISATSEGWLDYIELQVRRNLIFSSNPLLFRDINSANYNSTSYLLTGDAQTQIWNVSSIHNVVNIIHNTTGSQIEINIENQKTIPEFVAFNNASEFKTPKFDQKLPNQNLHAINNAEMLIIYNKDFEEAALRLKEHREAYSNILVEAIDVSLVYNEFSSGRVDPTSLRDFFKMLYDRNPNFKHILLLGDGSYDYRGVMPGLQNQNFVPVYETKESLYPIISFPSDDYYALLSPQDGANLIGGLDITVGRIPCKTANEANIVVNKIINYQTNSETLGDWRLRNLFTSDDEDSNLHYNQSESIAKKVELNHPEVNIKKVHIDAFVQESTPGGERYPEATQAIANNMDNGVLIFNYLGHGGPKGLAQERILTINDIINMNNINKLALFVTATCSFTGYDDPALVSAGENAILSPNGAAVALMTTVRSVYANENKRLTQSVFDTIYTKNQGKYQTIGEVIMRGKNNEGQDTLSVNARKFALIGDPSMTLSYPKYNINVTSLNDQAIGTTSDTIRALQKVKIEGIVSNESGTIVENFNGILNATIFDKKSTISTLKNDMGSQNSSFEVYKNVIFKGQVSVVNGKWQFSFIVPKDIVYNYGNGKMSFYASDGVSIDAGGYYDQFVVGGTYDQALADNNGPDIDLFMDTESFINGETTDNSPKLIVKLKDDNGINVSGTSIGHDLTAVLDNDTQSKYVLNDYYQANLDDYTGGKVEYDLSELELGPHQIKVKAFDISNNATESILDFVVIDESDGSLKNVLNYPNPFTTKTNFTFEHDFPNSSVDVLINIFTVSGKLVKTIQTNAISKGTRIDDVVWDGNDDYGSTLAKGVYLYKIQILDNSSNEMRESSIEKLVILK